MPLLNSHFDVLKIEEGIDFEDEEIPSINTNLKRNKKNKKKASSARKDINKLLNKLNNASEDDVNILADSNEDTRNSESQLEDEIKMAILHSKELELEKSRIQDVKNNHLQKSDGRKIKNKNIITMSLREFTSGDMPQSYEKTNINLEKIVPYDNENELAKSGFFTSAIAEKQFHANLERIRQAEIDIKLKQYDTEIKLKEKLRKFSLEKDQEISKLKLMENKLLEELAQVKKRNHQLNFMIKSPEMECKLKLIHELEELKQFVNEMNIEISDRQKEIDRENKSSADLRNQIDYFKNIKFSK